jgi:hypothetical protein
MRFKLILCTAVTALVAFAAPTECTTAGCSAFSFDTARTTSDPGLLSFGFQFSTTQAVTLSALGYYDDAGDGLTVAHEIGVFDSTGTLLYSTILGAGTSGELLGDFRYASIPLLNLAANQNYTVAATAGGESEMFAYGAINDGFLTGFVTDPAIQIAPNAGVFVYQPGLQYPTQQFGYTFYAGPNFLVQQSEDVVVPEPAAGLLLGPALGALLLLRNRRLAGHRRG